MLEHLNTIEIIATVLLALGSIFFLGAAMGIIRFPDFYTRMHAAGKGDSLSSVLILGALALLNLQAFNIATVLVSIKIMGVVVFIILTSPTSTHALMQAGYEAGMKPWKKNREETLVSQKQK